MLTYPMTIAGLKRELPICPLNENLAIGAFVIFGDPELTTAAARALLDLAPDYDYIITDRAIPTGMTAKLKAAGVEVRIV